MLFYCLVSNPVASFSHYCVRFFVIFFCIALVPSMVLNFRFASSTTVCGQFLIQNLLHISVSLIRYHSLSVVILLSLSCCVVCYCCYGVMEQWNNVVMEIWNTTDWCGERMFMWEAVEGAAVQKAVGWVVLLHVIINLFYLQASPLPLWTPDITILAMRMGNKVSNDQHRCSQGDLANYWQAFLSRKNWHSALHMVINKKIKIK